MELREAIKNRRSIRKFKKNPIEKGKIEELLNMALWAPSGMNRQNWSFFVVTGTMKDELVEISKESYDQYISESLQTVFKERKRVITESQQFFYSLGNAPVVVCAYRSKTVEGDLTDIQSVAAAIENFLLLLHEEGLGGCWMTGPVHLEEKINHILDVKDKRLQALIPVGVPDSDPQPPKRKEGRIEWIGWD